VTLAGVGTVSDDEVSSDGKYLLATAERGTDASNGFYLLSLADPAHPVVSAFVPVPDGTGATAAASTPAPSRRSAAAATSSPRGTRRIRRS
jgi:hypothetical protein